MSTGTYSSGCAASTSRANCRSVSAICSGSFMIRAKASSCSMPPARIVSVVIIRTLRLAKTARAASLAIVTVLPAPGTPNSISGWFGPRDNDSGSNV
ncbi:MAG: hypothetical protein WDN69_03380 [Aliidongia sp.]